MYIIASAKVMLNAPWPEKIKFTAPNTTPSSTALKSLAQLNFMSTIFISSLFFYRAYL